MTDEEIVRDYQQAKNKQKQIKILADLNCVSPSEIKSILAAAGVEGVTAPKRVVHRAGAKAPSVEPDLEQIPETSIYDRIEAILNILPVDASDRIRGAALDMVTAMFQEYVIERFKNSSKEKVKCQ